MDDGVVIEALVGIRPWRSADRLETAIRLCWGQHALNEEKALEEGEFEERQLAWGLHLDFQSQEISLPEPKCVKAKYMPAQRELKMGQRHVPLKVTQEAHGTMNYMANAQPAILPEMPPLSRMLGQADPRSKWVNPRGGEESVATAWEEWDDTLELLRVMVEDPSQWQANFTSAFTSALTLRERLAAPGAEDRVRFVRSDATLQTIGAIDWKLREYLFSPAEMLMEALRADMTHPSEEMMTIIAITELLTLVTLMTVQGSKWTGDIVIHVTDNMLVKIRIQKRRPRHPHARVPAKLAQRLEAAYGCVVATVFFGLTTKSPRIGSPRRLHLWFGAVWSRKGFESFLPRGIGMRTSGK